MPTYTYRCEACGEGQEKFLPFSAYTPSVLCSCGKVACRTYEDCPEVLVKGNQRRIKLDATDVPIGWERGNRDPEAQERRYARHINAKKKLAIANDKAAIKGGIRQIASVPRELDRLRRKQFGKDYWDTTNKDDIKAKLKSDEMLFKD